MSKLNFPRFPYVNAELNAHFKTWKIFSFDLLYRSAFCVIFIYLDVFFVNKYEVALTSLYTNEIMFCLSEIFLWPKSVKIKV